MRFMKKVISLMLALVLVLGLLPATVFATGTSLLTLEELRAQYGAITVEAYNLGQGFLVDPTLYAKETGQHVGAITIGMLESKGINYQGSESYFSGFEFDDTVAPEYPEYIDPSMFGCEESGDGNGYLTEFDYSSYSGWVFTIDNWFASYGADSSYPGAEITDYNSGEQIILGDVIRWHFTVAGWGADCGIPGNAMADMMGGNLFEQEEKTDLIFNLAAINDYYGNLDTDNVYETALAVAADPLASADDIAAQEATLAAYIVETFFAEEEPEEPREAQDVSAVLNATMAQMASTVNAPSFGTSAGEWTVLSLARGGYYGKDNAYFSDYYDRIVATVNEKAGSLNMNGALDANKSTDNSRLIIALSAIGKDATAVGNWNLTAPYSNFDNWVKKQGINGVIFALIALDSNDYCLYDSSIRENCVNYLLDVQHNDGGWSMTNTPTLDSNVDVTAMALQALYPYRDQDAVATACKEAITWLSEDQTDNGGFLYGSDGETSESAAQVIVALSTWGINPDTDSRFVKNGKSVVDNLLSYYLESEAMFAHQGTVSNNMATDQACYALVAYDRLLKGRTTLYDFSDVTFDVIVPDPGDGEDPDGSEGEEPETPGGESGGENTGTTGINAAIGLPAEVENTVGTTFNAVISVDNWDNTAGFKLVDFVMPIPAGLKVTNVTSGDRLFGGKVSWNVDESGNLRCVYFDANKHTDLTVSGTQFPVEMFTVSFEILEELKEENLTISIDGMSVKRSSDSSDEDSMVVVNVEPVTNPDGGTTGGGSGNVGVVTGISFSAVCLYTGDDIDLIPSTKKAVAVTVTGIVEGAKLSYSDGTNQISFLYNKAISQKIGVSTYVALVDASIAMETFINKNNFTVGAVTSEELIFGDANGDRIINAQDALTAVDAWLRMGDAPTDLGILTMNVNGDSRINTFDALGIVEAFVNSSTYGVVTKAATQFTKS